MTVLLISAQKSLVKKISACINSDLAGYHLVVCHTGVEGMAHIYHAPPALIIIDATLSDISGFQMSRVIKHDPTIRKLPTILISQDQDEAYTRLSELSVVADAFLHQSEIETSFVTQASGLLRLFEGLDSIEQGQLGLLRQSAIKVQPLNRLVQLYDQSITEVDLMRAFSKLFDLIPSKHVLNHMLFNLLETVLDYDLVGIFYNDKGREPRLMTYHNPKGYSFLPETLQKWTQQEFDALKPKASEPWVFHSIRFDEVNSSFSAASKMPTLKHRSVYPFFVENDLTGALVFFNQKPVDYDHIFPVALILRQLSALMRLRHYYSQAETLSVTDALTGFFTYQHFTWSLEREIRLSKRHETPLTLAMVSIQEIQSLDASGGAALRGDTMMKHLAKITLQNVRAHDVLGRYRERTVLILFSNTVAEAALVALTRIQDLVLASPCMVNQKAIPFVLNIGFITVIPVHETASTMMEKVQDALEKSQEKAQNNIYQSDV